MRQYYYSFCSIIFSLIFLHKVSSHGCSNVQPLSPNLKDMKKIVAVISGEEIVNPSGTVKTNQWALKTFEPDPKDFPVLKALGLLYKDGNRKESVTVFAVSRCHALTVDHARDLCVNRDCHSEKMKVSLGIEKKNANFSTIDQDAEFIIAGDKSSISSDVGVIRLNGTTAFKSFNKSEQGDILPLVPNNGTHFSKGDFSDMRQFFNTSHTYLTLDLGFPVKSQSNNKPPVPMAIVKETISVGDTFKQNYVKTDSDGLSCQNGMSGGPVGVFTTNNGKKEFSVIGFQVDSINSAQIVKALEIMQTQYEIYRKKYPNRYKYNSIWEEIEVANADTMTDCSKLYDNSIQVARR